MFEIPLLLLIDDGFAVRRGNTVSAAVKLCVERSSLSRCVVWHVPVQVALLSTSWTTVPVHAGFCTNLTAVKRAGRERQLWFPAPGVLVGVVLRVHVAGSGSGEYNEAGVTWGGPCRYYPDVGLDGRHCTKNQCLTDVVM
jgi:hypothetical protein